MDVVTLAVRLARSSYIVFSGIPRKKASVTRRLSLVARFSVSCFSQAENYRLDLKFQTCYGTKSYRYVESQILVLVQESAQKM